MRMERLELSRISSSASKTEASTNYATSATKIISIFLLHCQIKKLLKLNYYFIYNK